ncbi:gliding motility-associated C-terminal domain-containing protein [bacterium SCSIO 12741]|nr:gliding motility-associated C-terminal domain-containing protein [bacterium SCSIO 12741]
MKSFIKLTLLLCLMIFFGMEAEASHFAGGSIKYTYVGPGTAPNTYQYRITVGIIRYCGGAGFNNQFQAVTATCSSSGATQNFNLPKVNYVPGPGERPAPNGAKDVSDVCRKRQTNCSSANGAKGYELYTFEMVVTLSQCNSWVFTTTTPCCRNGSVNYPNSNGNPIHLVTTFNTLDFPKNSAPVFADEAKPMPSVCVGQDVFYGIGTYDQEWDSLVYSFTQPYYGPNTPANPTPPYTIQKPIPGITMDPSSGLISFKPTTTGEFIVAFWVYEYERCTGRLKGQTRREIQFSVNTCTNKVPKDVSGVSNIKGKATKIGRYALEVCQGETIEWEDTLVDQDFDSIYVTHNLALAMPGLQMTEIPLARNKKIVRFKWTATIGDNPVKNFFIAFDDDNCDFPGNGFSVFEIHVRNATSAGPDQTICAGDTFKFKAFGGQVYDWKSISGDPLLTGVNFFPDTTINDTGATGSIIVTQKTVLTVESDLVLSCFVALACQKIDTLVIDVVDSFSLNMPNDLFLCNPGAGQLDVNPSNPNFKYSYTWSGDGTLNDDTLKNPNFTGITKDTKFEVQVVSDAGCERTDSMWVKVTQPFPTNMQAKVSDSLLCLNGTVDLWVDQGSIDYGPCGTVQFPCQGTTKNFNIGGNGSLKNGANSINLPVVYGSDNPSAKAQFIYLASDLKARGMEAGPISSIAWEITKIYGSPGSPQYTPFNNFTIKMGCTSLNEHVGNNFLTNQLFEVFSPKAVIPTLGWNTHVFDNQYNWDGNSNIIVEVCWQNQNGYAGHHEMAFDPVTYDASGYYAQQWNWRPGACGNGAMSGGYPQQTIPRTQFGSCSGMRSSLFTYDWNPKPNGGFVGATNLDSAVANVNLTTTPIYRVIVKDSLYQICTDTLDVAVKVVNEYDVKPDTLDPQCIDNGYIQFTSPTPPTISNPGGNWSGAGIINNRLGLWDPKVSGTGSFWVVYEVTGDACANKDSNLVTIVGKPDAGLLTPDSLCALWNDTTFQQLIAKTPGGYFKGYGVDSIPDANGKMAYFIDGTKFNTSGGKVDTAVFTYTVFKGCWNTDTFEIPVHPGWDTTYNGILHNGIPYLDYSFCLSNPVIDTVDVEGKGGIWSCLEVPNAIIDAQRGVIDPALFGTTGSYTLKIEKTGFCGNSATIPITVVEAPEIDILDMYYCNDFCDIQANKIRTDTFKFLVAKGINIGGTGDTKLGIPGNDILLSYGDKASSGWPNAIEDLAFNFWDGGSWMPLPHIARFRPCQIPAGQERTIKYQFAVRYRTNHPEYGCLSFDSAKVIHRAQIELPEVEERFVFCQGDSIQGLFVKDAPAGLIVEWYVDTLSTLPDDTGSTFEYPGLDNSNGLHYVFARYVDTITGCVSRVDGRGFQNIPYKVYGNPNADIRTNPAGVDKKFIGEEVTYVNITEQGNYGDTTITSSGGGYFEWYTASGPYFGTADTLSRWDEYDPHGRYTSHPGPESELKVKYDLFGAYDVWLVAVNDAGCRDSIKIDMDIDQRVKPKFPNVFTPAKKGEDFGDGMNDWWSIITPAAEDCPCGPNSNGVATCYCADGEEVMKEWFKRDFYNIEGFIYDRWGRRVKKLTLEDPIWKGDNQAGAPQTDGTYFYVIELKIRDLDQTIIKEKGTITLLRESE